MADSERPRRSGPNWLAVVVGILVLGLATYVLRNCSAPEDWVQEPTTETTAPPTTDEPVTFE
ncbi:MAG: hypothetical protein R3F24_12540 [Gammaproteobacteria bacterium]